MIRDDATAASRARYDVAVDLATSCPPGLGQAIAVTGSVAMGIAEDDSDIDLNLWVEALPSAESRVAWIEQIGGRVATVTEQPMSDGTHEATFFYRGIWIEAGWMMIGRQEEILRGILSGEVLGHGQLVLAWVIEQALPLREGQLADWQQRLTAYPDVLAERLIQVNTRVWQMPRAMAGRWTYCRRPQPFALTERLTWDTHNVLRVLFALNRRWEPDWKWLHHVTRDLDVKPDRLAERIEEVFLTPRLDQRVATMMEVILDTLALLPASPDVQRARTTIRDTLAGNVSQY